MQFFQTVAEKAAGGAAWVKRLADEAVGDVEEGGRKAYEAASNGAKWTSDKAKDGYRWGSQKIGECVQWGRDQARAIVKVADEKGQVIFDDVVGGLAAKLAGAGTKHGTIEHCLEGAVSKLKRNDEWKEMDGKFMGGDCPKGYRDPPMPRRPEGCEECEKKFPKVMYVNGINTEPQAACDTMSEIANSRCVEVVGVYNATFGIPQDLVDCKNNIDRAGREASAHSQAGLIARMLREDPSQPVTIFAHSQGGLITQEALSECSKSLKRSRREDFVRQGMDGKEAKRRANDEVKEMMGRVDVYSFGTAERDWPPAGESLHQFTNRADPVPKVIDQVQKSRGVNVEPENLVERHSFEKPAWDPIDSHSMDSVYLPELNKVHPVKDGEEDKCC